MVELRALADAIPTLDPAKGFSLDSQRKAGVYKAREVTKKRTKKISKPFVKYEATKEHPAQVQVFNEDIIVGYWETINFSGAIPEQRRNELLKRIEKLQDAVKAAREEANSSDVVDVKIGESVFGFLLS